MSDQPTALMLADAIDYPDVSLGIEAAKELRRLHEENETLRQERDEARRTVREAHELGTAVIAQRDALLEALQSLMSMIDYGADDPGQRLNKARAALGQREHIIDGHPCWCNPETVYTDPETGASVIVHKEPQ